MIHEMKLYEENFHSLKNGNKKREYRLYDEKRQLIKIGDTIKFLKLPNLDETIFADVKKIEIFNDWYSCYEKYFNEDFIDTYPTIESVVEDTYNSGYYSKEETDKYGCCCITLSKIRRKL